MEAVSKDQQLFPTEEEEKEKIKEEKIILSYVWSGMGAGC